MNREDMFSLSRLWNPLIHSLKEQKMKLSQQIRWLLPPEMPLLYLGH
jgi:hypothetical protein